jgi:2-polyprenyl-3-methyl-5-hydroxy-6-metoxy-1,4-benzoquinol methylase
MSLLRRITFNLRYFSKTPWDSGISPPELLEFISQHKAGRAIDLGCGTGTNVITLARAGWQVCGIDFAPRAIQIAKRKAKEAGIAAQFFTGDVTSFKVDGQFDLALDMGCFHGVENRAAYLDQLTRILTPGGYWLLYVIFKLAPHLSIPGLAEAELASIPSQLTLLRRCNSFDRRERPSAWLLYQKSSS